MDESFFESLRVLQNNIPLDDFSGLTPSEMHDLLYDPLGPDSPLRVRKGVSGEVLDCIRFFRLTEEFLKIMQRDGYIKLTPLGALPRKSLLELYGHRFLPEEFIETGIVNLRREIDSVVLTTLPIVTRLSGLIIKKEGGFRLRNLGKNLLSAGRREDLFYLTLDSFTNKFTWANNDGYPAEIVGQFGWAYTVYLILKFGDVEKSIGFYAEKYIRAFPRVLAYFEGRPFGPPAEEVARCYAVRVFERFLEWFGFVEIVNPDRSFDTSKSKIKMQDVINRVFYVSE